MKVRLCVCHTDRGAFRALMERSGRVWWIDNPYPPEQVVKMVGPLYVGPRVEGRWA